MIRNFFYSQANSVFKPPKSTRFKVQHCFELTMTVVAFVRFINILLSVYWGLPFAEDVLGLAAPQIAWDPYSQIIFTHREHLEVFFLSVPAFWIAQAMLVNYAIYFRAGSRTISGGGFYELCGINFETVAQAMISSPKERARVVKEKADRLLLRSKVLPTFVRRLLQDFPPVDWALTRATYGWMFYRGQLVDLDRLRRGPRLRIFNTLSPAVRRWLFVICLLFDLFFFGVGCVVLGK